jgi:ABC-2 type transport system permease protein
MRPDFVPIFRRELRSMFQGPGLYVMLGMFFFISGLFFFSTVEWFVEVSRQQAMDPWGSQESVNFTEFVVRNTFGVMAFLYIFVIPILTMRLLSEEKRSGTFEMLATSPVSDFGIITGKFLAAVMVNVLIVVLSLVFVAFMGWIGQPEWPVVLGCLLGLFLIGVTYSSFGLFASSLSENQIIASIVTFVGLLTLYLINELTPPSSGLWADFLTDVSLRTHGEEILKGMIRLEDLAYYVLFMFLSLFLAHTVLRSRHWRV